MPTSTTPCEATVERTASTPEDHVWYLTHEIRSRLSSLSAKVYRLEGSHDVPLSLLEEVDDAVRHIAELVDEVAFLVDPRSPWRGRAFEVVDLNALAATVAEDVTVAGTHRVVIRSHAPVSLVADPRSMRRVLENLVGNALKYSDDEVVVELDSVEDAVVLRVRDRGVGIAHADRHRIFDADFRSQQHAVRRQDGTGLGLTMTKRLVEEHGGTIRASSDVGVGSTFTVVLPLRRRDT